MRFLFNLVWLQVTRSILWVHRNLFAPPSKKLSQMHSVNVLALFWYKSPLSSQFATEQFLNFKINIKQTWPLTFLYSNNSCEVFPPLEKCSSILYSSEQGPSLFALQSYDLLLYWETNNYFEFIIWWSWEIEWNCYALVHHYGTHLRLYRFISSYRQIKIFS